MSQQFEPGLSSINIGTARWLCNKNQIDGVVIIAFGEGQIKSASYGADVRKCKQLAKLIDGIGEQMEDGTFNLSEFDR